MALVSTCEVVRANRPSTQKTALFKTWKTEVATNPCLLTRTVEEGLRKLEYKSIKLEQMTAVNGMLKGEDMFVSVPTGFGKFLVFQLLPLCAKSLLQSCGFTKLPLVVSGVLTQNKAL